MDKLPDTLMDYHGEKDFLVFSFASPFITGVILRGIGGVRAHVMDARVLDRFFS